MRIVIDLQGAQSSGSRNRGIGRYAMSMTKAIIRNKEEHEIIVALNGLFPDTIEPIRADLEGLLPQNCIRVWDSVGPVSHVDSENTSRRKTAELVREAFLASLKPDILYLTSLFEGLTDNAVTSVGLLSQTIPTAVTLYDLIPFIHRDPYLNNPVVESWYESKLDHLRRSDLLLAISESSRQEGIDYLGFSQDMSINVGTASDPQFKRVVVSEAVEKSVRERYGLHKQFVMYTGGIDNRKNIEGLIRSYGLISLKLRKQIQLAIVCSIQPETRQQLIGLSKKHGMAEGEVVFTGFVSEDDLISLYNLCKLFIFPSWHEGFGLPALEAMSCGRAVIGANTSSLPEVIGLEDALFDPRDDQSIAEKICQVISNDDFRRQLELHGLEQAKRFSWDVSACKLIAACESWIHKNNNSALLMSSGCRLKLAYLSPLPPEHSGISDYSAELLVELARYYDIEVIVNQEVISDPWIKSNCLVRSVEWFTKNFKRYDRVLYHFGNSHFHQHMFDLLAKIPGVVVLHDFFMSGIAAHMEFTAYKPVNWSRELYRSHGYKSVSERYCEKDLANVIWKYPANLGVLQDSLGIVVHSQNSYRLAEQWYGNLAASNWALIPHLRVPALGANRSQSRRVLNLSDDEFVICSFGLLSLTKLNHRLLHAWINSSLGQNKKCILVFVGENHPGEYGNQLLETISASEFKDRIRITGWVDTTAFRHYLAAADLGVQLRTLSRGETSGTVLDCMNYGLPTIVNANGSMADLPNDAVWKLEDDFEEAHLINALNTLYQDPALRNLIGRKAQYIINTKHSPRICADLYFNSIEKIYRESKNNVRSLVSAVANASNIPTDDFTLVSIADSISRSISIASRSSQILIDVSELVCRDGNTGIQRVVRAVLRQILMYPPVGYRVEPIYAGPDREYFYARKFTLNFLGCPESILNDEPVDYHAGDIFLGLDFRPEVILRKAAFFQNMRRTGVQVIFIVYDLLPILQPQNFVKGADDWLHRWMQVISNGDGVVCISQSVAESVLNWLDENGPERLRPFNVGYFHLGSDIAASKPTLETNGCSELAFANIKLRTTFLVVGTLEPRKRHDQVLAAFDELWSQGVSVNLVFFGKLGWLMDDFKEILLAHPQKDIKLIWLQNFGDECLEFLYSNSSCLIAASEDEGFGLPLIEAAAHELPLIARDIPVFREVAGDCAFYFSGNSPKALADRVNEWLALRNEGKVPQSGSMPHLTWEQSASQLLDVILNNRWVARWMPDVRYRFHLGSDPRLLTQAGVRDGLYLQTRETAGCLLHGPYLPLEAGRYHVRVHMEVQRLGVPEAYIDVVAQHGAELLAKQPLLCLPNKKQVVEMEIFLKNSVSNFEVRVFVSEVSDLKISMLEIVPWHA